MKSFSVRRLTFIATAGLLGMLPLSGFAMHIVFDPTNFGEAVIQVQQDVRVVNALQQELQNQLRMIQGWGFSQLSGILQNMGRMQEVFAAAETIYATADPKAQMDGEFPDLPINYAATSDADIQQMRAAWNQQQRAVLVENRAVQNQVYQDLSPTAARINQYVQHSNSSPGVTAAVQAGNEELANVIEQVQALEAQEISDARGESERNAQAQAEEAYSDQQRMNVRVGWDNPPRPTGQLSDPFPLANQ